jgi:branched-chain amino acid transport system permease protein
MAAIGGVMWALGYPQLNPTMGIMPGLKCFIAAVLGGIGNITGAVLGGLILGFLEIMLVATLPALSGYRDAFAFVLLIIVLMVKPMGILGKHQIEKV